MKLFARPPSVDTGSVAQSRVDAIVAAARAQAQAPVTLSARSTIYRQAPTAALVPSNDLLDTRLAEELAFARRTLEAMGDTLCDDPILLSRHQVTLQSVDLLAQILGPISSVIGSANRDEAISRIGMVELRNRLMRESNGVTTTGVGYHSSEHNPFNQH